MVATTSRRSSPLLYGLVGGLLAGVLLAGVLLLCMAFFSWLPERSSTFGIDNLFPAVSSWNILYLADGSGGFKNPPWTGVLLMPAGSLLSAGAAWGLLVFCTLAITVLSVPRRADKPWLSRLALVLAITAYPGLRNIADANLDGLVVAGVLLLLAGYERKNPYLLAAGLLLASAKPQIVLLLLIVTGGYVLLAWDWRRWLITGGVLLVATLPPLLWRGRDWLTSLNNHHWYTGTLIDISLDATLARSGITAPLLVQGALLAVAGLTLALAFFSRPALNRDTATLLITASILVAPYVGGNSPINYVLVGIIPLVLVQPWTGLGLMLLVNAPLLWPGDWLYFYQANWWTLVTLLVWGIFAGRVYRAAIRGQNGPFPAGPEPAQA
ncbi:MAG: glycosyltransferase 87 family protein [Anaerolineae bacterium]|jgi:hypothetical protein|nr:glycosyltransferase 87 family protein [Anaerolineae bacterium]